MIDPIGMNDLLCAKGKECTGGFRGHRAQCIHAPQAKGQCGMQPLKLLKAERGECAEALARCSTQRVGICIQFRLAVRKVYER